LLHGEAVAIGLQFALALSRANAGFSASDMIAVAPYITPLWQAALKQNVEVIDFLRAKGNWQRLVPLFAQDKKNSGDVSAAGFVLLEGIGKPKRPFVTQLPLSFIEPVWQSFCADLLSKSS
jgi:3-dehydroquinate synthetase